MPVRDVVILSAARTPIGRYGGSFKDLHPAELGAVAARAAIERAGLAPSDVDEVADRPRPAGGLRAESRRARSAIAPAFPHRAPAQTINKACASSLQAIVVGRAVDHARRVGRRPGRRHRVDEPHAVSDRRDRRALGPPDGQLHARRRDVSRRLSVPAVEPDHGRDGGNPRRGSTASRASSRTRSRSRASARRRRRSTPATSRARSRR